VQGRTSGKRERGRKGEMSIETEGKKKKIKRDEFYVFVFYISLID